jgi:hypothetical protein
MMNDETTITSDAPFTPLPDPIWDAFGFASLDDFRRGHQPFCLRPEVPEAIRKKLGIVHKILIHSYYEYGFLDVAINQSLQIFEMVLRVRWHELMGKLPSKSKRLEALIEWADQQGLLEQRLEISQLWRELRNSITHGKPETVLGVGFTEMCYGVVDFVNDLYADPGERRARQSLERDLGQCIKNFTGNGSIMSIDGTRLILFHADIACCAIVEDQTEFNLMFYPIFDVREVDKTLQTPQAIVRSYQAVALYDDSIQMIGANGDSTILQPIRDTVNHDRYRIFRIDYDKQKMMDFLIQTQVAEQRNLIRRQVLHEQFGHDSSRT